MGVDIVVRVSGGAGQGVHTVGLLVLRMAVAMGCHVHASQDYMSRIRGGRNSYTVRVSSSPVHAISEKADIHLALDPSHLPWFLPRISEKGFALAELPSGEPPAITAPLKEMAISAGSPILANMVGAGIIGFSLGVPQEVMDRLLAIDFKGDFLKKNHAAIRLGMAWAENKIPMTSRLPAGRAGARLILSGNEAIALGAMAGGVKFVSGYPMTPGTGVLNVLATEGSTAGIVFEQAEDEIAAISMAIGASFAGARSMVATSGGGFALMVESLSLAGMLETPVVISLGMRPGPATGMPTRTEQGDLDFVLAAGHGEFPRIVYAPGSPAECFALAQRSMDRAEAFQVPAIILSDQYLADMIVDMDPAEIEVQPVRRYIVRGAEIPVTPDGKYLRYAETDSGVSPMAVPGEPGITVVVDSDEHAEGGHLTEDHAIRIRMVEKRLRKENRMAEDVIPPRLLGPGKGRVLLIGFGSTLGVAEEVQRILSGRGIAAGAVHLAQVWPFPAEALAGIMAGYEVPLTVEQNARGQLARLIRRETGRSVAGTVSRYDGLPFTVGELLTEVEKRLW